MTEKSHTANILIVDDTPANLRLLSNLLKSAGYSLRLSPSGDLALLSVATDPPDLILLDINMPEMDGFEVCKRLKADERLAAIPVLFISALTETRDKLKAFAAGGLDYITKPFQAEEVLARVDTHLKIRRYQVELKEKSTSLQQTLEELKATQSRLVQSEKMASLGVLTAGIAHEINNPVNFITSGINGLAKLLKDIRSILDCYARLSQDNASEVLSCVADLKEDLKFEELLVGVEELTENIRTGAERTAEIVKGLRTFSRLDEKDKKAIDLHENIESTLMLLHKQYKDHLIVKKNFGKIPMVLCYPGKLNQVIMNILSNAIDAVKAGNTSPEEAAITVETERIESQGREWVAIVFSDTGPGITADIRGRLFEPFFTTKEVGQGVGLGLSIAHGIIQDHGGRIEVESQPGQGATFRVWLPIE